MTYFDAAYIAKCYLNEPGAEKVRLHASSSAGLASCEFARIEFFSIVQRHLRDARIPARQAQQVFADFERDERSGVWTWLAVTTPVVEDACRRMRTLPAPLRIRAADALHLSCASLNGHAEVFTNDRHMLACAPHFGLAGRDLLAR